MSRLRLPVTLLFALLLLGPARAADDLDAQVKKITDAPLYKHARWGILVVDRKTGETVYERNPDQLFAPASVTKLYSGAAALVKLGARRKFETAVYRRGEVAEGRLRGDLIVVAGGDFTLGGRTDARDRLAFKDHDHIYANWMDTKAELTDTDPLAGLKDLALQVKAAGVRRVDGEVLIDDRLFAHARGSGSGPDLLTPIVVNDNVLDVVLTPAAEAGRPAKVERRPKTAFLQTDVRVDTVEKGKKPRVEVRHVGPQRYVVRGSVPVGHRPLVRICPVDEPAGFARALFIEALRGEGVEVRASILQPPQVDLPEKGSYGRLPCVAVHRSLPFAETLKVTLKVSHNLYASMFPLLLAVQEGQHTLAEGMRLQQKALAELGVDVAGIALESGAGGGNGDRVSPRATVQLLLAMAKRPDFAVFREALPVLGVDGTLADVVPADSPARGKVFAKTGTYGDRDLLNDRVMLRSKTVAGVMTTAGGRRLAFALFVNEVPLPSGTTPTAVGKDLGRLCEVFYRDRP
jgi:D-alanyl-D-alanine carboxypeptidase/D-alanyl-D-alanine-endopeptidase (penicillin-binding protein 4)